MEKFKIFEDFTEFITYGITNRERDFMHVDFNSETFKKSRESLAKDAGINVSDTFFVNQVHDKNIRIVDKYCKNDILDYDGLMTNCKGRLLATCYADCVPLLFFDPQKMVVASVHSGWKGTVKMIGKEAVNTMKEKYGSDPEDILVGIGPSIGPCCYEVGEEVYNTFRKTIPIGAFEDKGKLYADLWNANISILLSAGVPRENIECKGICTSCHPDRFFSYRKGDKNSGRFAAYIMLK